jgi:hypothetical protein
MLRNILKEISSHLSSILKPLPYSEKNSEKQVHCSSCKKWDLYPSGQILYCGRFLHRLRFFYVVYFHSFSENKLSAFLHSLLHHKRYRKLLFVCILGIFNQDGGKSPSRVFVLSITFGNGFGCQHFAHLDFYRISWLLLYAFKTCGHICNLLVQFWCPKIFFTSLKKGCSTCFTHLAYFTNVSYFWVGTILTFARKLPSINGSTVCLQVETITDVFFCLNAWE